MPRRIPPCCAASTAASASGATSTAARRKRRAWCSASTAAAPVAASPSACRAGGRGGARLPGCAGEYRRRGGLCPPPAAGAAAGQRRTVQAIAYVVDRATAHYCRPAAEEAARAIARGIGQAGANRDYLLNTVSHLQAMGVRTPGWTASPRCCRRRPRPPGRQTRCAGRQIEGRLNRSGVAMRTVCPQCSPASLTEVPSWLQRRRNPCRPRTSGEIRENNIS